MHKVLKVAESPRATEVSMQDASDRNQCHWRNKATEKIERKQKQTRQSQNELQRM